MTIVCVGIDLAKNVFALHGVDEAGKPALVRPAVPRAKLLEALAALPPCRVAMEACSGAHHWARQFQLAFHVTYWDRLGWPDRYADPLHTQRQTEVRNRLGARQLYTPQTVLEGRDWRGWWQGQALPRPATSAAPLALSLSGRGQAVDVELHPRPGAPLPARLQAFWAVSEDGHSTQVKAGENEGSLLRHAAVVRGYTPIPPQLLAPLHAGQPLRLSYTPPPASPGAGARRVVMVVADATSGRTLQAGVLACGS